MRLPVLGGDGIGPVVCAEAVRVLEATGLGWTPLWLPFGAGAWREHGDPLPHTTAQAVRHAGVALMGAGASEEGGCRSPVLTLRERLGLDVLVRPCGPVTLVCHASEGLYAEPESGGDPAVVRRLVTAAGLARLLRVAAAHATHRVTLVDKPTVFRHTAALFRAAAAEVLPADLPWELVNADAFVARALREPGSHDVVVALSFVGDVLSDVLAAAAGGVGAVASASLGPGVAVFEPTHGSAPARAGEQPLRVSPLGAIRAVAMLLDHRDQPAAAQRIRVACDAVAERCEGPGGPGTTVQLGQAVAQRVAMPS